MSTCIKCSARISEQDGRCPSCNASAPVAPHTAATAPAAAAQPSSWPWPVEDDVPPQRWQPLLVELHHATMQHQKKAQNWLMAFAILAAGGGLLLAAMLSGSPSPGAAEAASMILLFGLGGGAFYFVMWLWSHSNIAAAASVSIAVCVLDLLIGLLTSPIAAGLGLILKVFFIAAMARAIRAAHEERDAKLA